LRFGTSKTRYIYSKSHRSTATDRLHTITVSNAPKTQKWGTESVRSAARWPGGHRALASRRPKVAGWRQAGGAASSRLARQKPAGGLHALAGACQAAKATEVGQPTGKRTALRGGEAARGRRAGRERSAHLLPSRRRAQRGETLHARKARHPPTGFWPKEASVKPVTGSARPDATARGAGGGGGASPEERVRIEGPETKARKKGGEERVVSARSLFRRPLRAPPRRPPAGGRRGLRLASFPTGRATPNCRSRPAPLRPRGDCCRTG